MTIPTGKWTTQTDLELAVSVITVAQLCDDNGDSVADAAVVQRLIEDGEGELESILEGAYVRSALAVLPATPDRLIRRAAVDFEIAFMWMRHPEYVKKYGDDVRETSAYKMALARALRIKEGVQQAPDETPAMTPANIGGNNVASGPRMIIDDPITGQSNGGDF